MYRNTPHNNINVLIVDDHKMVREGFKMLLENETTYTVYEAENGQSAIKKVKEKNINVVLMDISMPDMSGITVCKEIKKLYPEVKVIGLSMHNNPQYIAEMIRAGASGYLLKDDTSKELIDTINTVYNTDKFISSHLTADIFNILNENTDKELTKKEHQVIKYISKGMSNAEIARELNIKESTVKNHVTNILHKLNLKNRTEMLSYCIRHGIINSHNFNE